MKFVTVREFRSNSAAVRKALEQEGHVVLTANGRPFAVLSAVNPDNLEEELLALRRARARAALDRIRSRAREDGRDRMSMAEVDEVVAEVRRSRRGRSRRGGSGRRR